MNRGRLQHLPSGGGNNPAALAFILRGRETVAVANERSRKVRTPQGTVLGNSQTGKPDGKRNREQTADGVERGNPDGPQVRVKRWCKRPPASRAIAMARQASPGARPSRGRTARPMSRVGRSSRSAMTGPDR